MLPLTRGTLREQRRQYRVGGARVPSVRKRDREVSGEWLERVLDVERGARVAQRRRRVRKLQRALRSRARRQSAALSLQRRAHRRHQLREPERDGCAPQSVQLLQIQLH